MAATDWIKMRCNLGTDPDVIAMAAKLDLDEFAVVGRLHAVWSWLDAHSEDGKNVPVTSGFLDRLTSFAGFSEALRAVGWLSGRDSSLSFPGYAAHNGDTAKARASAAKRQEKHRDKRNAKSVTNVTPAPLPEKRRGEKRKRSPLFPQGGDDGEQLEIQMPDDNGGVLPEQWKNIPKPDRKLKRVLRNDHLMVRIGSWFNRGPETLWTLAEGIALMTIQPPSSEVETLECYYRADIDKERDFRRHDLITLLNNWTGELDRARIWNAENE